MLDTELKSRVFKFKLGEVLPSNEDEVVDAFEDNLSKSLPIKLFVSNDGEDVFSSVVDWDNQSKSREPPLLLGALLILDEEPGGSYADVFVLEDSALDFSGP